MGVYQVMLISDEIQTPLIGISLWWMGTKGEPDALGPIPRAS